MKKKQSTSIWIKLVHLCLKVIGFFCLLLSLSFCGYVSIFMSYHFLVDIEAMSLRPPVFPDSVEIVSGEYAGGGSGGISKVWTYCTEASINELTAYFEPYVGEFVYHDYPINDISHYSSGWISGRNPIIKLFSYISGFGGYSSELYITLNQNNENCASKVSYSYIISYPAA